MLKHLLEATAADVDIARPDHKHLYHMVPFALGLDKQWLPNSNLRWDLLEHTSLCLYLRASQCDDLQNADCDSKAHGMLCARRRSDLHKPASCSAATRPRTMIQSISLYFTADSRGSEISVCSTCLLRRS